MSAPIPSNQPRPRSASLIAWAALALLALVPFVACKRSTGVPAAFRALKVPGVQMAELPFGGLRMAGSQSPVGEPRRVVFTAPDGPAELVGYIALRKHERGFSGDRVRATVHLSVEGASPVLIASKELMVPMIGFDNRWVEFRTPLKPHWRGRPIELTFESAFLDAPGSPAGGTQPVSRTPQKSSLAIGGPFIRTIGDRQAGRRDLVVVTLDTLRFDMLGAYGKEGAHTPVLDRLAEEGLLVETAYSTANATSPAHAALFTSLYTKDHRVIDNHTTLHYDAMTLAEILRMQGYETRACVSVRMLQQLSGLSQGFATFSGPPRGERTGSETLDDVETCLPEKAGAPLFLWVHFFDPHTPYLPPPDAAARIEGADGPPRLREAEIARYRAEISHTDDLVSRLLSILNDRGYRDPLLVIVADHGESLGEHGVLFKHEGVHSVVTRIPMLFHGPGVPKSTRLDEGLASMVDVMPTALDLVGVQADQGLRGRSLIPVVRGQREPRDRVFIEETHDKAVAIRTPTHLYVFYRLEVTQSGVRKEKGSEELYLLEEDAAEDVNRAADFPELCARFRMEVASFLADRASDLKSLRGPISEELREELRSMGYTDSEDPVDEDVDRVDEN